MKSEKSILLLRAADLVGAMPAGSMVDYALDCLEEPVDKLMLALALCDRSDDRCIIDAKDALFLRDGLLPMSKLSALKIYASSICIQILDGEIGALAGSELITRATTFVAARDYHGLDPFIYASSEVESRPEDVKLFKDAIVREAGEWLQHNPL